MKSFLSYFINFSFPFLCSQKEQVSDIDLKRLIDRVAMIRLTQNLDFDPSESKPLKTDYQIFKEVCEIFRLDNTGIRKIKISKPRTT